MAHRRLGYLAQAPSLMTSPDRALRIPTCDVDVNATHATTDVTALCGTHCTPPGHCERRAHARLDRVRPAAQHPHEARAGCGRQPRGARPPRACARSRRAGRPPPKTRARGTARRMRAKGETITMHAYLRRTNTSKRINRSSQRPRVPRGRASPTALQVAVRHKP